MNGVHWVAIAVWAFTNAGISVFVGRAISRARAQLRDAEAAFERWRSEERARLQQNQAEVQARLARATDILADLQARSTRALGREAATRN